jgi:hypothetical protein
MVFAQVKAPLPASILVFDPTLDSLGVERIKKYSLDSLRQEMIRNNPLDSVPIYLPDSLAMKVKDKSRKIIDPILPSRQRYEHPLFDENSFNLPSLDGELGKDKIIEIKDGIYPQFKPDLPNLKAAEMNLKQNSSDLEKISATEDYVEKWRKFQNIRDSLSSEHRDSIVNSLKEEAEDRATALLVSEIGALSTGNTGVPDMASFFESQTSTDDYNANRILEKSRQASQFKEENFPEGHREKLDALKKKYAMVSDSRVLDSLVKKTSLAHLSFFDRWEYGLMIRNPTTNPIQFELNTFAGFRINKLFSLGGGAWLDMMPVGEWKANYTGISLYAMHKIHKSLFAVGGYDTAEDRGILAGKKNFSSKQIWAGIGTETALFRKITLRSQVTYNLTQLVTEKNYELRSPWAVSLGIVHFK